MFEDKADEHVIESLVPERQPENVGDLESDVRHAGTGSQRLAFSTDSGEMSTEVIFAPGLFSARMTVWAPTPARFQDQASCGIQGIVV